MSDDATLDQEGAPGMDALDEGEEPTTTTPDAAGDGVLPEEPGLHGRRAVQEVQEEPGQDERPKSKHELAMEAVAANRLKDLEEELKPEGHGVTGGTARPDGDGGSEGAQSTERKTRVKVDGEDLEVGEDELIREYQKGRTADRRLEQAAEERKKNEAESDARLEASEPSSRE